MVPGPSDIYKCPNCDNFLEKGSMLSGNNFGEKLYSDGKSIAPMLGEYPDLTKCRKCNTIFWLSKSTIIGTYDWMEETVLEWKDAQYVDFLKIDDGFRALELGIAENKEEELSIRQRIWWSFNDRIRNQQEIFNDENDQLRWEDNVIKLLALLDPTDIHQKIMTAEIQRNLGNFDACIQIIESIDDKDKDWLKEMFINECRKMNRWVIKLY